jgi:integrase
MKGIYRMNGSRFYWYRWTGPDGKRRAVSLKTDDEAEAIKRARSVSHESFTGQDGQTMQASRLSLLVDRYLTEARNRRKKPMREETAKTVRYILGRFICNRKLTQVSDVTSAQLDAWLREYQGETPVSYAAVVIPFGRWLHEKGLVAYDPFDRFERPERPPRGRTNWIRKDTVRELIDSAPDDDLKFILYAGFQAGLRRGEISWAKVNWFDLDAYTDKEGQIRGAIHVSNDPKANVFLKDENRTVPLESSFREFLKVYLKDRDPNDFVLAPEKRVKGQWKYRYDFKKQFERHVKGSCTIHDMRRSFASNLASAGVSIYKIARWLGDGVQVVERSYGHLAPTDEDVDRVAA